MLAALGNLGIGSCACWREMVFPGSVSAETKKTSRPALGYPMALATGAVVWVYETDGDATDILTFCCHGNAGSIEANWAQELEMLQELSPTGHRFATFDYRGYGRSEGEPSPKNVVADALSVLEALVAGHKPRRVELYGRSLGGWVVSRMVEEGLSPGLQVCRVVLVSPLLGIKTVHGYQHWPELMPVALDGPRVPVDLDLIVVLAGQDEVIDNDKIRAKVGRARPRAKVWEFPDAAHNSPLLTFYPVAPLSS